MPARATDIGQNDLQHLLGAAHAVSVLFLDQSQQ